MQPRTAAYVDGDGDGYGQFFAYYFCGTVVPAGVVTEDGDCNDANSTMYPSAPGTGIGIDNNCNGTIDPDEEAGPPCPERCQRRRCRLSGRCVGRALEFGCEFTGCQNDADGDNAVTVSDVLAILSAFSSDCP